MYACRLLAVMDGHFNAGGCITVLSARCPLPLLSIGQHGTTAALGSVLTAPAQQSEGISSTSLRETLMLL